MNEVCPHCDEEVCDGSGLSSYCGSLHEDCVVGHQEKCSFCKTDLWLNMA